MQILNKIFIDFLLHEKYYNMLCWRHKGIHTSSWPSGNSEHQENMVAVCLSVPILPLAFFVMLSLGYENHCIPTLPFASLMALHIKNAREILEMEFHNALSVFCSHLQIRALSLYSSRGWQLIPFSVFSLPPRTSFIVLPKK